VTEKWVITHARPGGAWSAKQLAAIGVSWPPKKGWKQRVEGMEISEEQRQTFEAGAIKKQKDFYE
jgi:hypothetical protein